MKRRVHRGFTLIELLVVIVIIVVIAGWVVGEAGSTRGRGARARTLTELRTIAMGCESYKMDYGSIPRLVKVTEMVTGGDPPIDPGQHGNPNSEAYRNASAFLYVALSGDDDRDGKLRQPAERAKGFVDFLSHPGWLNATKDWRGQITRVNYLQDPFGYSYGYSTAAARLEDDFKAEQIAKGNQARRSTRTSGFNPDYDLWSTGGVVSTGPVTPEDRNIWIKNW